MLWGSRVQVKEKPGILTNVPQFARITDAEFVSKY
jgi:hypothetical protein